MEPTQPPVEFESCILYGHRKQCASRDGCCGARVVRRTRRCSSTDPFSLHTFGEGPTRVFCWTDTLHYLWDVMVTVMVRRAASHRCEFRVRQLAQPPPPRGGAIVAIVVPFRKQKDQDRAAQLHKFLDHMNTFLTAAADGVMFVVVIVQQSDDGRSFNRGALLNVGFREAARYAAPSSLVSLILHDVDLLPSASLLRWYQEWPERGRPTHLAGPDQWRKYAMPGYEDIFFGGVTALHPADFEAANGFPNDYWGWGMEDDQLRLRVEASGGLARGVARPPKGAGSYNDLDQIKMLSLLETRETAMRNADRFNAYMFQPQPGPSGARQRLDVEWRHANGLAGLRYEAISRDLRALAPSVAHVHVVVNLDK